MKKYINNIKNVRDNFILWTRRVLACVVCGVMAVSLVWAERVSEEDAALVANHFMNVTPSAHGKKAPAKRMVLKAAAEEQNQFYVYENANGEGWVMVAANDVVRPILAYSETGHFRTDNMPDNVKGWLGKYNRFIQTIETDGATAGEATQKAWRALRAGARKAKGDAVVGPLVQTQWDQSAPYDLYTPGEGSWGKNSTKSAVGCVATAMAQVMKYWEWPVTGTGSHTYQPTMDTYDDKGNYKETIIIYPGELTANFGETTYDWANMKNTYSSSYTQAQKEAVATLMYHCGISVDMMYGSYQYGGSGAYTIDYNGYFSGYGIMTAETALKTFFGYKSTLKGYKRAGNSNPYMKTWSDADWVAMLKAELDAARPIMYAGAGDEGGHSFICDGYDNAGYFHFNWGWSGSNDGYYSLSSLAPGSGGAGGGGYDFSDAQDVIVGIEPDREAVSVTGVTVDPTELTLKIKERAQLTATVLPDDASIKAVTWSSDNTAVAKVDASGVVTGLSAGTANITVTTTDGNKTATCAVTVTNEVMPATELVVDYGWVIYDTSNKYWILVLADQTTGVPWIQFYFDSGSANKIAGTYNMGERGVFLWNDPNDEEACVSSTSGQLTIVCTGKDNGASGCNTYHITSTFLCSDDLEYAVNTTLEICGEDDANPANPIDLADEEGDGEPFTITWMADGAEFTTTQSTGSVVLPTSEPAACDGKAFVGWCADAHYESETTAPTFVKNGDAVTEATTFYAVYATPGTGGSTNGSKTFKFSEIASANNWQNGESYTTIEIAPVTVKANGGGYNGKWYTSSNGSWRMYSGGTVVITVAEGEVTSVTSSPTCDWTISNGEATFSPSARTDFTQIAVNYTVAGGGTSYSDYTTSCTPAAPVYYTIRFFDQGTKVSEQSVLKGQMPEVPANPTAACEDYTFYGWWTAELAATNTTAQKETNFTATKDQDYYAIYSKTVTSGANIIQLDATKDTTFPKDGITLTVSNGVLDNGTDYRVYKGATLTISSSVGNMSDIALTYVDSYNGGGWADSYQPNAATWTSPKTTTGGSGKQARIKLIEITIGEGASSTTYYTSTVDCSWPTDVEESKVEQTAVKALRNGQIVIIRSDAVYSITGARIE